MNFRWPWRRKNNFAKDAHLLSDGGRALVYIQRDRLAELVETEHRYHQIKAQRSAAKRKGDATKRAKRLAEQSDTTAALRGASNG